MTDSSPVTEPAVMRHFGQPRATLERPLSQACTGEQMREPVFAKWCHEIFEVPRVHRKQWEFCYILQALDLNGMMRAGTSGLGFGVGREPIVALLASKGCSIMATDLEPEAAKDIGWIDSNEHAIDVSSLNERGICDPETFAKSVRYRYMNMNRIHDDLRDFDFCWSACALEHLGSIEAGLQFIEESVETLRPGGIAVHTTEFNCSSNDETLDNNPTVLFRRRDMEALAERLERNGHRIELTYDLGELPIDHHVDVAPFSADNHLKLQIERWATTSFGVIVHKAS